MKYCNDKFMQHYEYEALTFDDVSLMTKYSEILPSNTNLKTSFTKNIKLNIPFVSAAMDTVTGWKMAVAMAKNGGVGIVHKNMSIEEQANEIAKIKKFLNGYIENPVFFKKSDSIEYILNYKAQNEYNFSSFPVIDDKTGKLCGIITSHDFKFIKDSSEKVSNYMSTGLITGQKGIKFKQAYELMIKNRVGKLPVIDENKRLVGMFALTDIKSIVEKTISDMSVDLKHRLIAGAAISPFDYERIEALINNNVDVLVVDTAHGHSKGVLDTIREIKKQYSNVEVIGGNIATAEAALALYEAGADGVKVGIGPGSICTTRVVAGVGVPQVTAVYNCAKALRNKIPVIADGGIRYSGDAVKAIAAGASTVMMGSAFAGTEESPGEKILYNGRKYVVYRGMGSLAAMKDGEGSRKRYFQDGASADKLVPEGIEGMVPYSGRVQDVLFQFAGGIRAGMGYSGCETVEKFHKQAEFVKITLAGLKEAHPHDVSITKEAPNYKKQ